MSQLFETVRCENGKFVDLHLHEDRANRSRSALWGHQTPISFQSIQVPEPFRNGRFKCRIIYKERIEGLAFSEYKPRKITSLQMVESDLEYEHKFMLRDELDMLFEKRQSCSDVIIVKNGRVTDTSIANLIFFDGENWVTPDTPLFKGIERARLLAKDMISETSIPADSIAQFEQVMTINAMLPFDENRAIRIEMVHNYT